MTQTIATPPGPALTKATAAPNGTIPLLQVVARQYKVSPFTQFADIFRLSRGENRLTGREYYDYMVYRPSLSPAEKKEFVGEEGSFRLNLRLAPPALTMMRNFLSDKVALTALLTQFGLATTRTQAVFSTARRFGSLTVLSTAPQVQDWLQNRATFPLFGKPVKGQQAQGSVRIDRIEKGEAILGSGKRVALQSLSTEIAAHGENGYVFQDAVAQHPEVTAMVGTEAVSTIRVVTVVENGKPRVLYTLWKMPGTNAMSDNFWQDGSLIAHVDAASGKVLTVRKGTGPSSEWVEKHPVTGVTLTGAQLPEWQSVTDLALAAHAIFPINGILGWDIAIGPDGARIIECNENTGHGLYQLASGRGILNPDFAPTFAGIDNANKAWLAGFAAKRKAHLKAKSAL